MEGKIVLVTPNCIVAQLADGTFVRHDRSEHLFRVGDDVMTLNDEKVLYAPTTCGHVYLTPDYVSRNPGAKLNEVGWIVEEGL